MIRMRRTRAGEAGVKPGHIVARLGAARAAGRDGVREHLAACPQGGLAGGASNRPSIAMRVLALRALAERAQAGPRRIEAPLGACSGAQSMRAAPRSGSGGAGRGAASRGAVGSGPRACQLRGGARRQREAGRQRGAAAAPHAAHCKLL
jgi:hypothetical protein